MRLWGTPSARTLRASLATGGAERYLLNNGGESSSDDDEAGEEATCSQADDFSASLSNLKTLFR